MSIKCQSNKLTMDEQYASGHGTKPARIQEDEVWEDFGQ